jgi:hypothetical protein
MTFGIRLRIACAVAIATIGTVLGLWATRGMLWNWSPWGDSWNPMLLALERLRGPGASHIYETIFFQDRIKFQYPPSSLLPLSLLGLFIPLNLTTLNAVNAVVLVLNAVAMAALAYLVFSARPPENGADAAGRTTNAHWIALLAFMAAWLFYPIMRAFKLGQIQLWIDLAFTLAVLLWWTGLRTAAGFVMGLACCIKPQFALLLLWALLWKRWDFAKGFLLSALPVAALSLLRFGWHNHVAYLEVLSFISRHGESVLQNNSVNGIVNRVLFNGPILDWDPHSFAPYNPYVFTATIIAAALFFALPLLPALTQRARQANIFDFGIASLCFTMGAPVAWDHHYGIMLPLFVLVFRFVLTDAPSALGHSLLLPVATSWFLSAAPLPRVHMLTGTVLNVLQAHLFFGAVLLLVVLFVAAGHRGTSEVKFGIAQLLFGRLSAPRSSRP